MTDLPDRRGPRADTDDGIVRIGLRPGDADAIVRFHCDAYGREFGFDPSFEDHVRAPLAAFAASPGPRERIWIAERAGAMIGCVAIVEAAPDVAQLRWFLVAHDARGLGLGRRLLEAAIRFSEDAGYAHVILWTVSALSAAARLYRAAGFTIAESNPARLWGLDLVEEKYAMVLPRDASSRLGAPDSA